MPSGVSAAELIAVTRAVVVETLPERVNLTSAFTAYGLANLFGISGAYALGRNDPARTDVIVGLAVTLCLALLVALTQV